MSAPYCGFTRFPDLRLRRDGLAELTEALYFRSKGGRDIWVPPGFVTNLESRPLVLPGFVHLLLGTALETGPAAVVHDWLYSSHETSRAEADAVYFEILECLSDPDAGRLQRARRWCGRWLAWTGLRVGGWAAWR